jgi:excisionase family DNA binding protein
MSLGHTIVPVRPRTTLTVEEAARVLGIGRSTAYEAVRCGQIPAMRLGRRSIVPAAWLAQQLGVTIEAVTVAIADGEQPPEERANAPSAL